MAFEKMGLGGELEFEVNEAIANMTKASESLQAVKEASRSANTPISELERRLKQFGVESRAALKQVSQGFKEVATAARNTVLAFLPVTYMMKKGFDQAMDFEKQMSHAAVVTGATAEEMSQLGQAAKEMAVGTEDAPTAVLQAMEKLRQAGASIPQVLGSVKDAMDLADAAGMSEAQSAMFLGQTIKTMGLQFEDSRRVVDVLAKTSASAGTSVQELGAAMRMSSGLSKNLGISIEETASVLGVLAQAGYKGGRGGAALRAMLEGLSKPSKEARNQMAAWGVSIQDTEGKMLPLSVILTQLQGKLSGVKSATQKAALIQKLFTGRGAMAYNALASAGDDALKKMLENVANSGGAAAKMAEKMLDNTDGAFRKFWNNLKMFYSEVFEPFLEPVKQLLESITKPLSELITAMMKIKKMGLTEVLNMPQEDLDKMSTIEKIALGIVQAIDDVKKIWNGLVETIKSFGKKIGETFGKTGAQAVARFVTKVLMIGGVLAPIIGILGVIVKLLSSTVLRAIFGAWKMVKGLGMAFKSLGVMTKIGFGPMFFIIGLAAALFGVFAKKVGGVGEAFNRIWEGIKNTLGAFIEGFLSTTDMIWNSIKGTFDSIGKFFEDLFGWIWEDNDKAASGMSKTWGEFGVFVGWIISSIFEGWSMIFDAIADGIFWLKQQFEQVFGQFSLGSKVLGNMFGQTSNKDLLKELKQYTALPGQLEDDIRARMKKQGIENRKAQLEAEAMKAGIENKSAGKKETDKKQPVNVNITDERKIDVNNTLCIDGKKVAVAVSRSQTEIMERAGAKKEAYQKTAAREFGVTPQNWGGGFDLSVVR